MVRSAVFESLDSDRPREQLKRCAVVIPVYNHAERLAGVIEAALALGAPVFVVDDGSGDGSLAVARSFQGRRVTVLRHPRNRGKGAALLTGFAAAARVAEFAVTIDADGQHDPADARALAAALPADGPRPLVVGLRASGMEGAHVPWTSRFGRGFSNFWVRCSGGPRLRDTQSGLRAYPLAEVLALRTRGRRYQFEVEVLALARWHGIPVREVPVRVSYLEGRRVSHFRPFVDFWRNAWTFTRLITQRLLLPRGRRLRLTSRRGEVRRLAAPT
jgi:glycosyltransferase involved in cell wall biosynthesis